VITFDHAEHPVDLAPVDPCAEGDRRVPVASPDARHLRVRDHVRERGEHPGDPVVAFEV